MPIEGLILDVRGNGGSHIWAAEQILQTLTPRAIEPERVQFIVTPGTLNLCRDNRYPIEIPLADWVSSLEEAVETGASYSSAFPITPPARCNDVGQRYFGPVVLVTDGNCYSATDIFAAGFQDHQIGDILGTSPNTGAGGANVWTHELLNMVLPPNSGLQPLPMKAGMRVAIRQCLRVGLRAGQLLEDLGVPPTATHLVTRADLLSDDHDLLRAAGKRLTSAKPRSIHITLGSLDSGKRAITILTRNLRRLSTCISTAVRPARWT